jgi:hypothetical protein
MVDDVTLAFLTIFDIDVSAKPISFIHKDENKNESIFQGSLSITEKNDGANCANGGKGSRS